VTYKGEVVRANVGDFSVLVDTHRPEIKSASAVLRGCVLGVFRPAARLQWGCNLE